MGSDQSNPNVNEEIGAKLLNEVNEYNKGNIEKGSLRYQFLLMNARSLIDYDKFFSEVDINKIADYIGDLSVIKIKEGKRIVTQVVKASNSKEDATNNLHLILPKMRIRVLDSSKNEIYLSPAASKELYGKVVKNSYKTSFGRYRPNDLFDWKSSDVYELYQAQSKDKLDTLNNVNQITFFFSDDSDEDSEDISVDDEPNNSSNNNNNNNSNDNNNSNNDNNSNSDNNSNNSDNGTTTTQRCAQFSVPGSPVQRSKPRRKSQITLPVSHTRDSSTLILENPVDQLYKRNIHPKQPTYTFEKKVSRPFKWKKSIHEAAFLGDEASVKYCLYLLPILMDCPNLDGDTPAHKAALGGRPKILKLLHAFGANFDYPNDEGLFPLHMSTDKAVVSTLQSIGCDLNKRNKKGESLLEIKTRDFNLKIIESLLKFKVNILEPNPKGVYWFQFAMHGEYFKEMGFMKFQEFVRGIIKKNVDAEYFKNQCFAEIIKRKVKKCDVEDEEDINDSVTDKNIERIKVLLALGAHADRVRPDGKTNLMLCAERDDDDIARILCSNFCDPNFSNYKKENTFWVASSSRHFKTALVLRDYGVNMNCVSTSGNTLLHEAYNGKNNELFTFLLDAGASPNTKNSNEESVLFQAFRSKDDQTAEMLQDKYNGNINTQGKDGNSLAHLAIIEKDTSRLEYYLKRGIDIEIKNKLGYSLFMTTLVNTSDLELCTNLLRHGANINSQDIDGNTPLLNILHAKKFKREKFDFLMDNNCNIDLQNKDREFPISVCIMNKLDDEADILLSKGSKINDPDSLFEPIVCALKVDSQRWFEKLLSHGATAVNTKYPVLANYIKSDFFEFKLLKSIRGKNVIIGGPTQAALRKGLLDVANYFWDNADEKAKKEIASTPDEYGMIPISVAMRRSVDEFVKKVIKEPYDVSTPDNDGITPFMHACQTNNEDWMKQIFERIDSGNANLTDNKGNAALTYAANNKYLNFCNYLFTRGIGLTGINDDKRGIISAYRDLLNIYEKIRDMAQLNYSQASEVSQKLQDEVNKYERICKQLKKEVGKDCKDDKDDKDDNENKTSSPPSSKGSSDRKLEEYNRNQNYLNETIEEKARADLVRDKYKDRLNFIKDAQRDKILYKIRELAEMASDENDIKMLDRKRNIFAINDYKEVSKALILLGIEEEADDE